MSKVLAVRNHFGSIRLVAIQFLSVAGIGIVFPYVNIYLTDLGFSGTLIGTLASVGAILSLVLTPVFNQIADRLMLHRRLFMIYLGGFALANLLFATAQVQLLIIVAVLLVKLTTSPSMTLGMQLTMTQLIRSGKAILGQLRSFSALGFASASVLATQVFAIGGYRLLFITGAAFALISIQLSTIFPAKPKEKVKPETGPKQPRNRGLYVLAASQFFITMCTHNSFSFMFIHFNQNLGVETAHIGIWAAILGVVEFPFYFLLDAILPKVRVRIIYIFGVFGIALMTLAIGIVPNLPLLVLLFVFRGLAWPAYHLSSYRIVSAISHPRNVATNQAIVQVTMPGIALLLTGSLFGWVFDNLGAGAFFAICGVMAAIGACIVIAGFRLFEGKTQTQLS